MKTKIYFSIQYSVINDTINTDSSKFITHFKLALLLLDGLLSFFPFIIIKTSIELVSALL